ncbi:MAG: biopolymer transporter ExbD [Chitinophagaceae bacterium]|nr:biopolymer transporter ExbD [Chitinophagaceae bacterium]
MSEIVSSGDKGGKGSGKKRTKSSTRVDMTPMVDLAFLLITFFMLTTTLSKQQIMQLNMPDKNENKKDRPEVKESQALTLILGENDKVFWYTTKEGVPDFHETNFNPNGGIRQVLLDKNKHVQDLVVVIKAQDKSKYINVVDIIDEMHITKTERYALVEITKEDDQLVQKQLASDAAAETASN